MFRAHRLLAASLLASVAAAGVLTASPDALAIGQSTGRVTGTVTEAQTEAPVPGATLTLTGGSGVKKVAQTNDDGSYEIGEVPPGTYDLTVTYAGLKPLKRRVVVNADAATPVLISWSAEVAAQETTVVQEERHLTNPDSPQTGQIYSVDRVNQLPIGRSYQSITPQIPGVTATSGGNAIVKGAHSRNNRYVLNGLDITDPVTNTFSANFQQDAIESVQVMTGGFEAKYNALGSITSLQTKRGTNEYHGAFSAYWQPTSFVDYKTFGPQTYDGGKPWDYSLKAPDQTRYQVNITSQGPIVKDKLFYNAGIQYLSSNVAQPAGPPRFVQAPSRSFKSIYLLAGITFVPVDEHRFHVEASADPTTIDYENNDAAGTITTAGANNANPLSQRGRYQGGYRITGEWAWQASSRVSTKLMFGYNQNVLDVGPQGIRGIAAGDAVGAYSFNRPRHINQDDSTWWFNDAQRYRTTRERFQIDGSVTVKAEGAGRHEAELGLQSAFLQHREQTNNTGGPMGPDGRGGYGVSYTNRGGGPLDSALCDVDPAVNPGALQGNYTGNGCFQRTTTLDYIARQAGNTLGFYVQDRWKPTKRVTLLPGVRWDVGTIRVANSPVAVTGQGFGPRFSVITDLTGDQKTIAQFSYGRSTEMPYLLGVAQYDGLRREVSVLERYNADTRNFEFFQKSGGADGARFSFRRKAPSVDEILLSLRREVLDGTTARIDYTYRAYNDMFSVVEVNSIMDPTGTRTVGFRNGIPQRVTQYGFEPAAYNRYSGVDLIFESRVKNFELQGGYTLSWSWGPGIDPNVSNTAFENPRFTQFYYSFQPSIDTRHQIKTATTYTLGGATVGLILNWRSGIALRRNYPTNEDGYTVQRTPSGHEPGSYYNTGTSNPGQNGTYSDVRSWAEFRTPDLLTANLMVSYNFKELLKQNVIVNLQVDNVLGLTTPTSVNQTEGAPNTNQFGLASGRQSFRAFTLGLRYEL